MLLILIGCAPPTLNDATARIRRDYPDVTQMSTAQLAAWLNDKADFMLAE